MLMSGELWCRTDHANVVCVPCGATPAGVSHVPPCADVAVPLLLLSVTFNALLNKLNNKIRISTYKKNFNILMINIVV